MRLPNPADLPRGELREIYLHWTGGGNGDIFDAYHFCVATDAAGTRAIATHDLRANMRDVRGGGAYAAHTHGRNSYAIGVAICAMRDATPHDFGAAPMLEEQIELACALVARLCSTYGIALPAVRTHAEAALEDGYFGCGGEERWDIARLRPAPGALASVEAKIVGDDLRARVGRCARAGW
ncbi:MAG: N-acetylmuramoyl-L-alanine amidase [Candidatus Eremiobacteraeota bacterium]|nr:N-acetylmuramoyl-L-alanine amidase [Candidatus Eremiobacteraeota bacterium]